MLMRKMVQEMLESLCVRPRWYDVVKSFPYSSTWLGRHFSYNWAWWVGLTTSCLLTRRTQQANIRVWAKYAIKLSKWTCTYTRVNRLKEKKNIQTTVFIVLLSNLDA